MLKNKKAFTLVELLVVIAIIAILSAVLMPNLFASIDRAKEARDLANIKNAKTQTLMDMIDDETNDNKDNTFEKKVLQLKGIIPEVIKNIPKPNKKNVAEAIAENIGGKIVIVGEYYTIEGIKVPGSSITRITVESTTSDVYIKADHVSKEEGERLSDVLGYGKLATPSEIRNNPSLKNENIFWNSSGLSVGGHGGKAAGNLSILLYKFEKD